jgi:membrane-associated phospholipid phosphatase
VLKQPPDPTETMKEVVELHRKQAHLVQDRARQREIVQQADTSNLSDIMRPLGIEAGGFENTIRLIEAILQIAERVGYFYKAAFDRVRPNAFDPRLRPFIPVPAHASYPSNHAFQMFSVAEVLSRMIPEHPGSIELFHVAERVAENREYAGLHYKSDTKAGQRLARLFAPYLVKILTPELRQALAEWH